MKKYALCSGINNYPGTQNDLNGCVNDAKDFAAALNTHGFDVRLLLDKQATRSNFMNHTKDMINLAQKGDSIIITNSSHGTQVPDENSDEPDKMDEAICVISDDHSQIDLILDDEFWQMFRQKRPGVQIVMFSDSCHSGTVVRAFDQTAAAIDAKKKFIPWQQLPQNLLKRRTEKPKDFIRLVEEICLGPKVPWPVGLMAGCQDNEYSYDAVINGRPNGAFTAIALQELVQLQKLNPKATYNDWFIRIRKRLPNRDYPQTPRLIGSYINSIIFS
jgi:molybdopterin-guanine dinucleotide biosynthesis protein